MATATRIRVLSFEPLGAFGGMDIYDRSFHNALARQTGIDVTWVTSDAAIKGGLANDDPYETWIAFRRVFGTGSLFAQGLRYAQGLTALVQRARKQRRGGPVVIHQQFLTVPVLELAAMLVAQFFGVPWVVTPHEPLRQDGSRRDAFVRRWMFRRADALIALSHVNQSDLSELTSIAPEKIVVTPHGHLNDFRGSATSISSQTARQQLRLDTTAPTIVFLGEMRPVKGLEVLLRSFPMVRQRIPNARLVVAGRPHRFNARRIEDVIASLGIAEAVTIHWGFVSSADLGLYMRSADVIALPYLAASQSGVCFTAYAFERAVVASDVGGLAEQVVDGITGLLVPPDNPDALAAGLSKLLLHRANTVVMGQRAREWAARERSWNRSAALLAEVYLSTWQRRHAPHGRDIRTA
jgi:glycosyltransferase involved in cell wall biosynthesis